MKPKHIILITIVLFVVISGYVIHRTIKGQLEIQQTQRQEAIRQNPDIAKFYK